MGNPLFGAMGGGVPNIQQLLAQIKANPASVLAQRFRLPQGVGSDPNAILQHLVKTGQVSQGQIDAAYQQAQRLGLKK